MSDEFVLVNTLGEGAFGKVYKVKRNSDDSEYAMKVIDLRTSPAEEKELAVKEAEILKKLKHGNVLQYIESFESDGALCIVTEYCPNGDLSEYLSKRGKKKLEEDKLKAWFKQIASALQYLHNIKIIHRDVKTPNVFLSQNWEVKLGDMGLAKVLERPTSKAVTFCGSPYYMSPEIFSCKPYDAKSDIWALGVIVYEMATLERPFDAMLMHQLVFKIVHGGLPQLPTGYQDGLCDLLKMIMQKDPGSRPTAEDIIKHDYLKSVKPVVHPKVEEVAGAAGASAYGIIKPVPGKKGKHGADGPFDMQKLMDTLSMRQKDAKKKPMPEGAVGGYTVEMQGNDTVKGIKTIIAKESPGRKIVDKFKKDVTIRAPVPKRPSSDTVVSVSDVNLFNDETGSTDFENTLQDVQSQVATDAFNVMQLIVRTMTGLFPGDSTIQVVHYRVAQKDDKGREEAMKRSTDPQAVMLRQIEHLQYYCTKVLNNDVELFTQAYDLLGREKDENKLEELLIGILGHEKFGLCGVQLMFLKNFEYNLHKLNSS